MKVLIVSDSHGLTLELEQLMERHRNEVELFIHCGDSELSADHPAIQYYAAVRGNCDADQRLPSELLQDTGSCKILITHGHRYSVKSDMMKLSYKAREYDADIVCFGHTHFLGAEMVFDTLFINPGSICLPRGRREKTYVILEILEDKYKVKIYDYEKGEISSLEETFSYTKD
jgi:putative phosphoesterase